MKEGGNHMSIFSPVSEFGKALESYWESLEDNRGDRAILRRCDGTLQVVMTPIFQHQLRDWRGYFSSETNYEERLAQIMGLLAHVRFHRSDISIAKQMATGRGGDPAVSELRFQRLLQRTRQEYYQAMIRVIKLLRGEINIHDLAESTYFWGDNIRKKWAYAYYENISNKKG